MIEPTPQWQADRDRDEIARARREPPEHKMADGVRLFDRAVSLMLSGIRMQHPEANEQAVRDILRERMEFIRRVEAAE